ncbi:hypothetical protein T484DRAFT_1868925 [Baffinella frigidus]|nr:hypothetical protein T484DRAFT_1868925 [Cryptophyta sp. CCMP2293]
MGTNLSVATQELLRRAGGFAAVVLGLTGLSTACCARPTSDQCAVRPGEGVDQCATLLLDLADIFALSNREFTALCLCYWLVSGPEAVQAEASLCGGMFYLRGTHMRSWMIMAAVLRHPKLVQALGLFSGAEVQNLCFIAMLACHPDGFDHVCMNARVMFWQSGFTEFSDILWTGEDMKKWMRRTRMGLDTENLVPGRRGLVST